jgi:tRNA-dihydrouridine synthase B
VNKLLHPLQIGTLRLENNLALAPMAGTTDRSFRIICHAFGAGLTITELVSARGICHDASLRRNWRYLAIDPAEVPVGIQLFGSEPADFRMAIQIIGNHPLLSQCSLIDLNMGCPAAKVLRSGAGAALMQNPELAGRIIESSVRAAEAFGKPVTVKFRKGWDTGLANAVPFARLCEAAGASALTIHGRTREQMYGGFADWQVIGAVKNAVRIAVYGSGDVKSADSAADLIRLTGVDGVMIGRAAQGCPWLFQEIAAGLAWQDDSEGGFSSGVISMQEKVAVVTRHLDGLIGLLGEAAGVREMRGQLTRYFKGTPGGSELKKKAMSAASRQDVLAALADWHRDWAKSCENS